MFTTATLRSVARRIAAGRATPADYVIAHAASAYAAMVRA